MSIVSVMVGLIALLGDWFLEQDFITQLDLMVEEDAIEMIIS